MKASKLTEEKLLERYEGDPRMAALALFLDLDEKTEMTGVSYNNNEFEVNVDDEDRSYIVLTDSEADTASEDYLDDTLDDMLTLPSHLEMYFDRDAFIQDNKGDRGGNLNGYDGSEEEVEVRGTTYYIYRRD